MGGYTTGLKASGGITLSESYSGAQRGDSKKLLEELRGSGGKSKLRDQCPYPNSPPDVEAIDANRWTIDGVENDVLTTPCAWLAVDRHACADCILNPDNKPDEPTQQSPFLQHLIYLENLQAAGATFLLSQLTVEEWNGLITVKAERAREQAKEIDDMKNKR